MGTAATQQFYECRSASIGDDVVVMITAPESGHQRRTLTLQRSGRKVTAAVWVPRALAAATSLEFGTLTQTDATSPMAPSEVEEVASAQLTDEEARDAVLHFVKSHPGAYASDVADALSLPIRRAFAVVDALISEGKIAAPRG